MAWEIKSASAFEAEAVEKLGAVEWKSRKELCEEKREQLREKYGFEAAIVVGNQFESIAVAMDGEQWLKFSNMSVAYWYKMVFRLAGC